jgi:hypothetical protein
MILICLYIKKINKNIILIYFQLKNIYKMHDSTRYQTHFLPMIYPFVYYKDIQKTKVCVKFAQSNPIQSVKVGQCEYYK